MVDFINNQLRLLVLPSLLWAKISARKWSSLRFLTLQLIIILAKCLSERSGIFYDTASHHCVAQFHSQSPWLRFQTRKWASSTHFLNSRTTLTLKSPTIVKKISIIRLNIFFSAIFAMGLVGSGTNNARLAQMLRQLALFYQKDANALMMVRIAQGTG